MRSRNHETGLVLSKTKNDTSPSGRGRVLVCSLVEPDALRNQATANCSGHCQKTCAQQCDAEGRPVVEPESRLEEGRKALKLRGAESFLVREADQILSETGPGSPLFDADRFVNTSSAINLCNQIATILRTQTLRAQHLVELNLVTMKRLAQQVAIVGETAAANESNEKNQSHRRRSGGPRSSSASSKARLHGRSVRDASHALHRGAPDRRLRRARLLQLPQV